MLEARPYFSEKRKLHLYKTEASALPNKMYIFLLGCAKGEEADKSIFCSRFNHYKTLTKTVKGDMIFINVESGPANQWAVRADKDYQGIQHEIRTLISEKSPKMYLSCLKLRLNCCYGNARVVAERYFGRSKSLWAALCSQYKWIKSLYNPIYRFCAALTNHRININPLRVNHWSHHMSHWKQIYRDDIKDIAEKEGKENITNEPKRYQLPLQKKVKMMKKMRVRTKPYNRKT